MDLRLLVKLGLKRSGRLLGGSPGGAMSNWPCRAALLGSHTHGRAELSLALSHPTPDLIPLPCPQNLLAMWDSLKTKALGVSGVFWRPGLTEALSAALYSVQNPRLEGKKGALLRHQQKDHWQDRCPLFTLYLRTSELSCSNHVVPGIDQPRNHLLCKCGQ